MGLEATGQQEYKRMHVVFIWISITAFKQLFPKSATSLDWVSSAMSLHFCLVVVIVLQVHWQWLRDGEHFQSLLLDELETGSSSGTRLVDTVDRDAVASRSDVQIPVPKNLVSFHTWTSVARVPTKQIAGMWAAYSTSCPRCGRRTRASLRPRMGSRKTTPSSRSSTLN